MKFANHETPYVRKTHAHERTKRHHEIPVEQPPTLREERDFQRHIMSIGREGSDRLRAFLAQLDDVG